MGVTGRFVTWLLDTYFPDSFVPREDFDHVQNREFPVVQRDLEAVRADRDSLLRENHRLLCDNARSVGFLLKLDDPVNGQVDIETKVYWQRDRFAFRVMCEVSDDLVRVTPVRLMPRFLDDIARMFAGHIKRQLIEKFQPIWPGAK
jgi:hypothetical protein